MSRRHVCIAVAPLLLALAFLAAAPGRPAAAVAAAAEKKAAASFEVYQDKGGEYRWRLRAQNSQVLAVAPDGYREKRACLAAIESVKRDVADAPVKEEEAKP